MKVETKFNQYGWKLIVNKSKEGIITISQRSKTNIHMIHKPMELRLQPEDFVELQELLTKIKEMGR